MSMAPDSQNTDPRLKWLYKASSAAAVLSGTILLLGMLGLLTSVLRPGAMIGGLSSFEGLWLIVIFKLHAGFRGVHIGLLKGLNLLDLGMLALVATMHLSLYAELRKTSQVWSIAAAIQPFLGVALFLATANAGRSSVMGATLAASVVMLRSAGFTKATAYAGILASVLLLAGDFSAGIMPASAIVAAMFGAGYLLLATWFFLVAQRLWRGVV